MPSIKIDNNNNVIDVTSNKIIGKMENGNIILLNESNENSNNEIETTEKESKTNEEKDLMESQKKEELKKEKSSFVQEITK